MKQFKTTSYGLVNVVEHKYSNGRIAIQLVGTGDMRGEPIHTLTTNLVDANLLENEFAVRTQDYEKLTDDAITSGLFFDTGKRQRSGYVIYHIWRYATPEDLLTKEIKFPQFRLGNTDEELAQLDEEFNVELSAQEILFNRWKSLGHRVELLGGIVQNPLTEFPVTIENVSEWLKLSKEIEDELYFLRSETLRFVRDTLN